MCTAVRAIYLASGIDGMEIHVTATPRTRWARNTKRGRLVIYGDVGQAPSCTGAKGGEIYVNGQCGRQTVINAAGRPRVVITALASISSPNHSWQAPAQRRRVVVLNGIEFDDRGVGPRAADALSRLEPLFAGLREARYSCGIRTAGWATKC
jgi:hypothetical protein